jgi:hypothetical protein
MGMGKRLSRKHAVYTPRSGTTIMVNYDAGSRILEVQFIEGDLYHYLDVPPRVWKGLVAEIKNGGSSGAYVNKTIKPKYKYEKIEDPAG